MKLHKLLMKSLTAILAPSLFSVFAVASVQAGGLGSSVDNFKNQQMDQVIFPMPPECDPVSEKIKWDGSGWYCVADDFDPPITGCEPQNVNWGDSQSSGSCNGVTGLIPFNQIGPVANTTSGFTGSANMFCQPNGTLTFHGPPTCTPNVVNCSADNVTWTGAQGAECSANVGAGANRQTQTLTNITPGNEGDALFECRGTGILFFRYQWVYQSGSCTSLTQDCTTENLSWGIGCQQSVSAAPDGAVRTINAAGSDYMGSATYTCNDGDWDLGANNCVASMPCPAGTLTWGAGCAANTQQRPNGGPYSYTNSAAGYTGASVYMCDNGNWILNSGASNCDEIPVSTPEPCSNQRLDWGVGCQTFSGNRNHGQTINLADATEPFTGVAEYTCNDGEFEIGDNTCVEQTFDNCSSEILTWGNGCRATFSTTTHTSTRTRNNAVTGFTGQATARCDDGDFEIINQSCNPVPDDCSSSTESWGVGCTAFIPAGNNGTSSVRSNTAPGFNGSARFTCSDGDFDITNATCNPEPEDCSGGNFSWGGNCSANVGGTNHGDSRTVANATDGFSGTATFSCNDGSFSVSNDTCNADPDPEDCSGGNQDWGSGCSATFPSINHGASATRSNVEDGFTGSATFSCNDGTLNIGNNTCNEDIIPADPCSADRLTWSNCAANVSNSNDGQSRTLTNDIDGYNGNAIFSCNDGDWQYQSGTCTIIPLGDCAGARLDWGGNCSDYLPPADHDFVRNATNDVSGYNGTAQYRCEDGTFEFISGECNQLPVNCSPRSVTWGNGCTDTLGTRVHDATIRAVNDASGFDGEAQFRCNDGSYEFESGSCDQLPDNCPPQSGLTWGAGCIGATPILVRHGNEQLVGNTSDDYSGSATFACNDGLLEYQSGSCTYIPNDCPGGRFNWGENCSDFVSFIAHGNSRSATNDTPGYSGSAVVGCDDGSRTLGPGATCQPSPCPSTTLRWDACRSTVSLTNSGQVRNLNNQRSGYTGSAQYTCTNGSWVRGANNCALLPPPPEDCSSDTVTWGGGNCSSSIPMGNHLSSNDVNNTAPDYDGNATFTCNDGSWIYQSGNCVEEGPADCSSGTLRWGSGNQCSSFTSSTPHGGETGYLDFGSSSSSFTGEAEYVCNDGEYIPIYERCQPRPNACGLSADHRELCAIYQKFFNRFPEGGTLNYWLGVQDWLDSESDCREIFIAEGARGDDCRAYVETQGFKPLESRDNGLCTSSLYNNNFGGRYRFAPNFRSRIGPNSVNPVPFCSARLD